MPVLQLGQFVLEALDGGISRLDRKPGGHDRIGAGIVIGARGTQKIGESGHKPEDSSNGGAVRRCRNGRAGAAGTMNNAVWTARARISGRLPRKIVPLGVDSPRPATVMHTVPTGFSGVPPPGPAMPVTADADIHRQALAHTLRHGLRHRLAHGTVPLQQLLRHTELSDSSRCCRTR